MADFLRKNDYMAELRKDEERLGPLKIIKLPSSDDPIFLSEATPRTLANMGLFYKTNALSVNHREAYEDFEFEFHDVNE